MHPISSTAFEEVRRRACKVSLAVAAARASCCSKSETARKLASRAATLA